MMLGAVGEVLGDLFGHLRDHRRVVEPDANVGDDDASRLPRDVDHVGAEEEAVRHRRRPRVLRDQGRLVPADLFHEVAADAWLVRAPEPAAHGHEGRSSRRGEWSHDCEHGAADEVAHQILAAKPKAKPPMPPNPRRDLGRPPRPTRCLSRRHSAPVTTASLVRRAWCSSP